jgi:hypothetical protein
MRGGKPTLPSLPHSERVGSVTPSERVGSVTPSGYLPLSAVYRRHLHYDEAQVDCRQDEDDPMPRLPAILTQ